MKIRNGFVSNSSASSFIVKHKDDYLNPKKKPLLDNKTIKKLLKFGFKATSIGHPSHLDNVPYNDQSAWKLTKDNRGNVLIRNFGYWVTCNEDEVIRFLVRNNISFIASVHYGHFTYSFHKGDKHLMVFRNYGMEVETYHQEASWNEIMKEWKLYSGGEERPYYRIPITAKFLKSL